MAPVFLRSRAADHCTPTQKNQDNDVMGRRPTQGIPRISQDESDPRSMHEYTIMNEPALSLSERQYDCHELQRKSIPLPAELDPFTQDQCVDSWNELRRRVDVDLRKKGWKYGLTKEQRFFFINDRDQITTWHDPRIGRDPNRLPPAYTGTISGVKMSPDCMLPSGWGLSCTLDGRIFFWNDMAQCTTWFDPRITELNDGPPLFDETASRKLRLRLHRNLWMKTLSSNGDGPLFLPNADLQIRPTSLSGRPKPNMSRLDLPPSTELLEKPSYGRKSVNAGMRELVSKYFDLVLPWRLRYLKDTCTDNEARETYTVEGVNCEEEMSQSNTEDPPTTAEEQMSEDRDEDLSRHGVGANELVVYQRQLLRYETSEDDSSEDDSSEDEQVYGSQSDPADYFSESDDGGIALPLGIEKPLKLNMPQKMNLTLDLVRRLRQSGEQRFAQLAKSDICKQFLEKVDYDIERAEHDFRAWRCKTPEKDTVDELSSAKIPPLSEQDPAEPKQFANTYLERKNSIEGTFLNTSPKESKVTGKASVLRPPTAVSQKMTQTKTQESVSHCVMKEKGRHQRPWRRKRVVAQDSDSDADDDNPAHQP